jgi:hypothetical protein
MLSFVKSARIFFVTIMWRKTYIKILIMYDAISQHSLVFLNMFKHVQTCLNMFEYISRMVSIFQHASVCFDLWAVPRWLSIASCVYYCYKILAFLKLHRCLTHFMKAPFQYFSAHRKADVLMIDWTFMTLQINVMQNRSVIDLHVSQ